MEAWEPASLLFLSFSRWTSRGHFRQVFAFLWVLYVKGDLAQKKKECIALHSNLPLVSGIVKQIDEEHDVLFLATCAGVSVQLRLIWANCPAQVMSRISEYAPMKLRQPRTWVSTTTCDYTSSKYVLFVVAIRVYL